MLKVKRQGGALGLALSGAHLSDRVPRLEPPAVAAGLGGAGA